MTKIRHGDELLTTGRLIEAVMKYRGMSYAELAAAVGEHPMNFCKVLNGRRIVTQEMADKVSKVLRMSPLVIMQSSNIEFFSKQSKTRYDYGNKTLNREADERACEGDLL